MGVYDFNTTAYDINEIIRQLKHELQSIVVNSQSNITEIKQKISADEALLDRLKKEVDELPDFTKQYNELRVELDKLKVVLDEISKHPIILDNIDVSDSGKLYTEVQKINHQLIYANHAVHDASGRNIIDTYATKDEIADIDSSLSNKKDKQIELTFDGSATKTVKKITQNVNGELDVEFIDIAGGGSGSQIEIESPDNSIAVSNETVGSAEKYKLSVNTDVVATKESVDEVKTGLNNLTGTVDNHTAQIGQIQEDINGIDSSLTDKKDRQPELTFDGSSIKTVKKITQNVNGELDVEFEDIDYPDYNISSPDGSINVSTSEGVTDLTLPGDVVRDSNYVHIEGATEAPSMDGIASVGISAKYAREDHVHPTDTSREDKANKTTVVLGTSNSKYPTDKAVAEFVNSSIATNTANYISNNGEPFTSVEQLEAYSGPVTNNDYAFVTGTDSEGNTYYDRYKATVSGETVTWALEYRLNNSSFTAAQWSAINSGITSVLVAKIHEHSNKDVLDGITSSDIANWNSKQDALTFDTTPTAGSTNPVTSDGIKTALDGKASKVANATSGHFAGLDANGNLTDSGHKHEDYALLNCAYGTRGYITGAGAKPDLLLEKMKLGAIQLYQGTGVSVKLYEYDVGDEANAVLVWDSSTLTGGALQKFLNGQNLGTIYTSTAGKCIKAEYNGNLSGDYLYCRAFGIFMTPKQADTSHTATAVCRINGVTYGSYKIDTYGGLVTAVCPDINSTKVIVNFTPSATTTRMRFYGFRCLNTYDGENSVLIGRATSALSATKATQDSDGNVIKNTYATKTELNAKQNSLTAGDNITIDGNTISSNQVFVATYGTTKYAEVKAAFDAGKICTVFNNNRYYYIKLVNDTAITFEASTASGVLYSIDLFKDNRWTPYTYFLQSKLTFDSAPTAGSNNPVTSDGIKKAIGAVNDVVVDLSQSVGDVKDDLNNLAATAGSHATQIGQLQTDVESIESSLANKKDRQTELNFGGSATKTVKSITQDANGVINVEYENIDFVRGDSNVEIKSEDNSVNVVESTDSQTNTKTYDISVADSVKSKIKDITISNDTLVIIGD